MSCNSPSSDEGAPPSRRKPAAGASDQKNRQGAGADQPNTKNRATPVVRPGTNTDKNTSDSTTKTPDKGTLVPNPSGPSPAPTGGGSAPNATDHPPGAVVFGDARTQQVIELQTNLTAFADLIRGQAPAAVSPVDDAQQLVYEALELAGTRASLQDEMEKSVLDTRILLKLATSRSALSRAYSAGLSGGTWPDALDKAYLALVQQYQLFVR